MLPAIEHYTDSPSSVTEMSHKHQRGESAAKLLPPIEWTAANSRLDSAPPRNGRHGDSPAAGPLRFPFLGGEPVEEASSGNRRLSSGLTGSAEWTRYLAVVSPRQARFRLGVIPFLFADLLRFVEKTNVPFLLPTTISGSLSPTFPARLVRHRKRHQSDTEMKSTVLF